MDNIILIPIIILALLVLIAGTFTIVALVMDKIRKSAEEKQQTENKKAEIITMIDEALVEENEEVNNE